MPSSTGAVESTMKTEAHRWAIATLIGLCILSFILAMAVLIYRLLSAGTTQEHYGTPEAFVRQSCKSPACIRFADILHETMNHSVNPCVNFYQYTCSNVSAGIGNLRTRLAQGEAVTELMSQTVANLPTGSARRKTFLLYNSCLKDTSKADIAALRAFLKSYNMILGNINSSNGNPLEVMFTMAINLQDGILIHLGLDYTQSATQTTGRQPLIHPLRFSVSPELKAWAKWGKAKALQSKNGPSIATDILQLVWEATSEDVSFSETAHEINLTEGEVHLQLNKTLSTGDRQGDNTTVIEHVEMFSDHLKATDLLRYLSVDGLTYRMDTKITLEQVFFKFLDGVLTTIHPKRLMTYLSWELGRQLRMYIFDETTSADQSSVCLSMVERLLGAGATMGPLAFRYVTDTVKNKAKEIFYYVRTFSATSIRDVRPSSDAERAQLEGLAHGLEMSQMDVVYPNDLKNERDLDTRLNLVAVTNISFIQNYLNLSEIMWHRTKLRGVPDWLEWTGVDANVVYKPGQHLLVPASYLMLPLFSLDGHYATNLGTFGWSMAEVIWHALNTEEVAQLGVDAKSHLTDVYAQSTRCLKTGTGRRYVSSVFHAMGMDIVLDVLIANTTQGDRALKKAVKQLFFVSSCLEDCGTDDAADQCNVAVMNQLDFAKVFECSDEDKPGEDAFCDF